MTRDLVTYAVHTIGTGVFLYHQIDFVDVWHESSMRVRENGSLTRRCGLDRVCQGIRLQGTISNYVSS